MVRKILMVGIDGAPFELVQKWCEEGQLPNLRRLIAEGASGPLESILDETPPAWSSIYTGKNAGKHGIFDFLYRRPRSYSFGEVNSSMRDAEDIWETMSKNGMRVGVLNAPLSYPVRPLNGFLVSGFLTPQGSSEYAYPRSLREELKREVPEFLPSSPDEFQVHLSKDVYAKRIAEKIESLRRAALHLLRKGEYDFFAVFVSETDFVQHWFWREMVSRKDAEGRTGQKYSGLVLETYKAVDRLIGELLGQMGEESHVVVVSDHGGTLRREVFRTNLFLHSIGMLSFKRGIQPRIRGILYSSGVTSRLYRLLYERNIFVLKFLLRPIVLSMSDIDWTRTAAFSVGYGQIYLNIKGREPLGVLPEEKKPEVENFLAKRFLSAVSKDGAPLITQVRTKDEVFHGPHADRAPDLLLIPAEGVEADRFFTQEVDRSGTHTTRGLVILKGEGVAKEALKGAAIVDVAPTILAMAGLPIPSDVDGRVLAEAFTSKFLLSNPIRTGEAQPAEARSQYELTKEEQQQIEDNLRSLGYV